MHSGNSTLTSSVSVMSRSIFVISLSTSTGTARLEFSKNISVLLLVALLSALSKFTLM